MIVVSHRGPVAFRPDPDGGFIAKRGAGGVVSALAPLLRDEPGARWIAAALGEGDRAAVAAGAATIPGLDVELLLLDPELHHLHYDVISNGVLWFCLHGLFDTTREPVFDRALHEAWDVYREVNRVFATAVAEGAPEHDVVLVQDFHLTLVPGMLATLRPDLHVAHFTHTPFASPRELAILPDGIAAELLDSLTCVPAGFHTERWVGAFTECANLAGRHGPPAFAATFGPDTDSLHDIAGGERAAAAAAALDERVGERTRIVRTDRVEPSKNVARGFLAYDELLDRHPEWRERVSFVATLNPSRESLPAYRAYREEIEQIAERVNERWARSDWEPIVVDTRDDFPRSVAALRTADVLLVNPLRDGLNLVAMEGPTVNERDAVLCLSREAGSYELLRDHCIGLHPFDVSETADALHQALTMDPERRSKSAAGLRDAALAYPPDRWLRELVSRARTRP